MKRLPYFSMPAILVALGFAIFTRARDAGYETFGILMALVVSTVVFPAILVLALVLAFIPSEDSIPAKRSPGEGVS